MLCQRPRMTAAKAVRFIIHMYKSLNLLTDGDQRIITVLWTMDIPQSAADQPSNTVTSSQVCSFLPYNRCEEWLFYHHYSLPLRIVWTTKYVSHTSLTISASFLTSMDIILQVVSLLKNVINEGAIALERLSEQGKIYNCRTWSEHH